MALRTAAIYAAAAGLWILVSDRVVAALTDDPEWIERISVAKGWFFVGVTSALLYFGVRRQVRDILRDAVERRRAEELAEGNQRIMEMIAAGAPVERTLEALIDLLETLEPEMICSVLLLDKDGQRLHHGAARRLPEAYIAAIEGIQIGPAVGSCGTAAFRRERVIVSDIAADPLWQGVADLALRHGLRACWSTPFIEGDRVLGTFAVYYRTVRLPDERHLRLIDQATHAAALCVSRHRAEQALRESEARFRTLVDQASDACYVCDAEGRLIDVNRRACEVLGYTRAELLVRNVSDVDATADPARNREIWGRMAPGDRLTVRGRHRRKDGAEFPVEVSIGCLMLTGDKAFLGLARDTTERDAAEQALRASASNLREAQERLKSALEVGGIGTFVVDFERGETIWDDSLTRLYGVAWEPADGAGAEPYLRLVHPDDRERVAADIHLAVTGASVPQTEYRIVRPDHTTRWIATTARAEHAPDGRPLRLIGASVDITARKLAEENLRQAQKLEAIGQLAGGVAHDFNNILTVIQAGVSFLEYEEGLTPSAREFVAEIKSAATRAGNLTRQLLTFSRRQAMQLRPIEVNEIVANMSRMLERVLGEHIEVDLRLATQDLPAQADPGMLEQVVMNLSVNARDAMPEGGRLTITTRPAEIAAGAGGRAGRFVCIETADTGTGIPDEVLPHIFEPFYTTKEAGRGTGLGLATVQGIVEQHGGWVEVQSEIGVGTRFRVYLPRQEAPSGPPSRRQPSHRPDEGSEVILLVEDETVVRALVRNLLRRCGYEVLEAPNGPRAVELWNRSGREIDLLVTDLVMPDGMSGFDLAQRLRRDRPGLRVIFTSGYSPEMAGRGTELREGVNFLAKPFDLENLTRAVRAALDQPEASVEPPAAQAPARR